MACVLKIKPLLACGIKADDRPGAEGRSYGLRTLRGHSAFDRASEAKRVARGYSDSLIAAQVTRWEWEAGWLLRGRSSRSLELAGEAAGRGSR